MKWAVFFAVLVSGCVASMPDDPAMTADIAWGAAGVLTANRPQAREPETPVARHCAACGGRGVMGVQAVEPTVCRGDTVPADGALIVVEVREDARVAINGGDTAATGRIRQYMARNLAAGKEYEFAVRVDDDTRTVTMKAGDQANLSFVPAVQTCRECGGTGLPSRSVVTQ